MLVAIPDLLDADEVRRCRALLARSGWVDGRATAGDLAARSKSNLQLPAESDEARLIGDLVLAALGRSPAYTSAVLPLHVLPPMVNRYDPGMTFGAHVDNAIRAVPGGGGARLRADVSTTVFLTDPQDYEGGELEIEDTYGLKSVKLPAGHAVVYPASSLHRVRPVLSGSRWGCFFWAQSMIREDGMRAMLHDLDRAIIATRSTIGDDHPAVLQLVNHYHNLLRRFAEL